MTLFSFLQIAKSSPSDETLTKESVKKKVVKEGKKVKKKKIIAAETSEGKENKTLSKEKVVKGKSWQRK